MLNVSLISSPLNSRRPVWSMCLRESKSVLIQMWLGLADIIQIRDQQLGCGGMRIHQNKPAKKSKVVFSQVKNRQQLSQEDLDILISNPKTKTILKRASQKYSAGAPMLKKTASSRNPDRKIRAEKEKRSTRTLTKLQVLGSQSSTAIPDLSASDSNKHTIQIQNLFCNTIQINRIAACLGTDPIYGYTEEIFNYLRIIEMKYSVAPNCDPPSEPAITDARWQTAEWMIKVHVNSELEPSTIFLAVNLVDRALASGTIIYTEMELLRVTCLFIAGKYEQVKSPTAGIIMKLLSPVYTKEDLMNMEGRIMQSLQFNMGYISPLLFIDQLMLAHGLESDLEDLAYTIAEFTLLDMSFQIFKPSELATSITKLSYLLTSKEGDTEPMDGSATCFTMVKKFITTISLYKLPGLFVSLLKMKKSRPSRGSVVHSEHY